MRHRIILGAGLAALLLAASAVAGDGPKSGPQVGEGLVPFNPLNLNGPAFADAGNKPVKSCPV
jgi:hypothetical protein